jgi:asparagine synthase (glutamine-hydrolysing)
MLHVLRHRGPDGAGLYHDDECGLAHTRLAIIDVAGGAQPMASTHNDLVAVFNGEIFNYVELRDELVALGHVFRTCSDTEVAIEAYRAWGDAAFARFNGQFAIALWSPRTRTLTLARDRLGVRPLYVCTHRGDVVFASEVKAVFAADPEIPRAFDPAGLAETFTFWTVVAPRTPFRGVEELRPGHVRTYTPDGMHEHAYWQLSLHETAMSLDDATAELRAALEHATRLRLVRADVPVGCYVSGGLDSSVIAALASGVRGRLRTFSLRFSDGEYDEGEFQRLVVERLGGEHRELAVTRADIAKVFPEVIRHTERPILRTAPAPLLLLSRFVRDCDHKVVLTGEGADEMLAGYDLFREARVRRFWARAPGSQQRPRLLDRLYPYLARSPVSSRAMAREFFGRDLDRAHAADFAHGPRWRAAIALQRMFSCDQRAAIAGFDPIAELIATLPPEFSTWDPLARDQYLEIRTLLSGYLLSSQGDRMAMANGVEGRFPFLDSSVVELACAMPADHKLRVLDEKHVLKRVAEELVPRAVVRRPKQPYRAPDALAFCEGADWIEEVVSPAAIADAGVFDATAVARLWAKCRSARGQLSNADNMALVGVLSTQLLHREVVRARPSGVLEPSFSFGRL